MMRQAHPKSLFEQFQRKFSRRGLAAPTRECLPSQSMLLRPLPVLGQSRRRWHRAAPAHPNQAASTAMEKTAIHDILQSNAPLWTGGRL